MRQLWVVEAQLGNLPPEVSRLHKLTTLSLRANYITSLPPEMAAMSSLHWLCVADNRIRELPDSFSQLSNLSTLNLDNNQLEAVPPCLCEMTSLVYVSLQQNPITSLSDDTLLALSSLTKFDLRDTKIGTRPEHWKVWRCLWVPTYRAAFYTALEELQ